MSLLPSRPDAGPAEDAGPRVVGVYDSAADDVLDALSSGTARQILAELHEDPAPPSELAERVDTSIQNVRYHLEKLEDCGAVEVVDTGYSEKGREMDIYAPADQPLVVFAGDREQRSTLRTALKRLLGAVGLLAVTSVLVQALFGDLPIDLGGGGGPDGQPLPPMTDAPTSTPQPEAPEGVATLPPGLLFFAGGLLVIAVVAAVRYRDRR